MKHSEVRVLFVLLSYGGASMWRPTLEKRQKDKACVPTNYVICDKPRGPRKGTECSSLELLKLFNVHLLVDYKKDHQAGAAYVKISDSTWESKESMFLLWTASGQFREGIDNSLNLMSRALLRLSVS